MKMLLILSSFIALAVGFDTRGKFNYAETDAAAATAYAKEADAKWAKMSPAQREAAFAAPVAAARYHARNQAAQRPFPYAKR